MSPTLAESKCEIIKVVQSVGKKLGGFWEINLDTFLTKWREEYSSIKLKKREIAEFLRTDFFAENAGGQRLRINETSLIQAEQCESNKDKTLLKKDGPKTDKTESDELKRNLSLEILGYLSNHLETKDTGSEDILIEFNKIHELWQSQNQKERFLNHGVGSFKKFLVDVCKLREAPNKENFLVNVDEIITKINLLNGNEESGSDKGVAKADIDGAQSDEKGEGLANYDGSQMEEMDGASTNKSDDLLSTATLATQVSDDDATRDAPTSQESQEISANAKNIVKPHKRNKVGAASCVEDEEERILARQRFNQLVTVLYDCCLVKLRNVFMEMHPTWKNTKQDVQNMEKGKFKCAFKNQETKFQSGDINQWDISLICNVLRNTKVCQSNLKTNAIYKGYDGAIRTVAKVKNIFYSHISSRELAEKEFEKTTKELKIALEIMGVNEDDFTQALEAGKVEQNAELYIKALREELDETNRRQDKVEYEVKGLEGRVSNIEDILLKEARDGDVKQKEIPKKAEDIDPAKWDEWLNVKDILKNVDTDKRQYILIADRMPNDLMEQDDLSVLGRVRWKVVFDLDPNSDIDGLLKRCSPEDSSGGIVVPVSPGIRSANFAFDAKRMHWIFANGKNQASEDDIPKETLEEWKTSLKTPIQDIVRICCENLDSRKSTYCIILSIRTGVSNGIANNIAKQIYQRFSYSKYDIKFVSFEPELDLEKVGSDRHAVYSNLPLKFFFIGLHSLLGESQRYYEVPSRQKGLRVPIRQFQYMSEYLDILYKGCENVPNELSKEDQIEFENEHLKSFLQGNPITFESLHYGHDARRSLTSKIFCYITSMPQNFNSSQIVQITHAPGTGGTTIARRVLWELKEDFPCMIVKEKFAGENTLDSDIEPYVMNLWERIRELEKLCEKSPVVLIDGSSRMVKLVSDQLVRRLAADGKRTIILRCVDYEGKCEIDHSLCHTESDFEVESVLKDEEQDLKEFRTKFLDYCTRFDNGKSIQDLASVKKDLAKRTRVFHFPMMAMLGDFTKLKKIVFESLVQLEKDSPSDYEVAILVAFIQLFASSPTPSSLLEKYFKKQHQTYNEMSKGYSVYLLNLMVSETARSKPKFIAQNGGINKYDDAGEERDGDADENGEDNTYIETYSFQHYAVAKLVWEKSGRQLDDVTQDFVKSPLLRDYKKNKDLQHLIDDLFLYNKVYEKDPEPDTDVTPAQNPNPCPIPNQNRGSSRFPIQSDDSRFSLPATEHRFSLLMTKLATFKNSGRIFEDAAKIVDDITYFSHAARYFVYERKKPDFEKALELIRKGLEVGQNASAKKRRDLRNTEGYIRLKEMRYIAKSIATLDDLKFRADKAHTLFHRAKDNPPRQFPNPLLGIVSVWLFCFEQVIKLKDGKVEEALATCLQEDFFSKAIGECFQLLDEVDTIVRDNPKLIDPDHTMQLCNDKRLDLMKLIGRTRGKRMKRSFNDIDVPRVCEEISKKHFKTANNKEILRLKAVWMINQAKTVQNLSIQDQHKLFTMLNKLVKDYNMYEHTRNLLDVAAIQDDPPFEIGECQDIIKQWQQREKHDAFSYLYDYALSFICVANGDISENRARFDRTRKLCFEKTQWSQMRYAHLYYMVKSRQDGIGQLISHDELVARYAKKLEAEKAGSDIKPEIDKTFWKRYADKLLHECSGRICIDPPVSRKGRVNPYIALEQGQLRIYISPHMMGVPYKDYRPDSKVKFYICFSLSGPKALEIRLVKDPAEKQAKA